MQEIDAHLSFPIGSDCENTEVFLDFSTHHLILLVGESGSGKSIFHENLYRLIMKDKTPKEVGFIFLDMTGVETWKGPHTVLRERHPLRSIELLEVIAKDKVKPDKYTFIHIEECDMFMNDMADRTETAIREILEFRRDISIVYSTSRPSSYGPLRPSLLELVDVKVVFHQSSIETYAYILGFVPSYMPKSWEKIVYFDNKVYILQPYSQSYAQEISQSYAGFETGILSEQNVLEGERLRSLTNDLNLNDKAYNDAKNLALAQGYISSALIQREMHTNYERACHLMDLLEQNDVIDAADGAKPRKVK